MRSDEHKRWLLWVRTTMTPEQLQAWLDDPGIPEDDKRLLRQPVHDWEREWYRKRSRA